MQMELSRVLCPKKEVKEGGKEAIDSSHEAIDGFKSQVYVSFTIASVRFLTSEFILICLANGNSVILYA